MVHQAILVTTATTLVSGVFAVALMRPTHGGRIRVQSAPPVTSTTRTTTTAPPPGVHHPAPPPVTRPPVSVTITIPPALTSILPPPTTAAPASRPRIALEVDGTGPREIAVLDSTATVPVVVTAASSSSHVPSVSPDGRSIAFGSTQGAVINGKAQNVEDIFVMNFNGTGVRRVTTYPLTGSGGGNDYPRWSPDGRTLTYSCPDAHNVLQVCVIGADGKGNKQVTSTTVDSYGSVFSPDGKRIVFARTAGAVTQQLWMMNADGTGAAALPVAPFDNAGGPTSFSPDGSGLLFSMRTGGRVRVASYSFATKAVTLLGITDPAYDAAYCGSGGQIIYSYEQGGRAGDPQSPNAGGATSIVLVNWSSRQTVAVSAPGTIDEFVSCASR